MNTATIFSAQFQENIENLWPIWKSTISDYENILVWWEMIKYKIKQLTSETSRTLHINKQTIAKYEKRIDEIKDSNKYLDKQEFLYLQKQIKHLYEKHAAAAKVRSRIKYMRKINKIFP